MTGGLGCHPGGRRHLAYGNAPLVTSDPHEDRITAAAAFRRLVARQADAQGGQISSSFRRMRGLCDQIRAECGVLMLSLTATNRSSLTTFRKPMAEPGSRSCYQEHKGAALQGTMKRERRCSFRRQGPGRRGVRLLSQVGTFVVVAPGGQCLRCDAGLVPCGLVPELVGPVAEKRLDTPFGGRSSTQPR
jgi:hypothetical protein